MSKPVTLLILTILLLNGRLFSSEFKTADFKIYLALAREKYYSNEDVVLTLRIKNNSGENKTFCVYDSDSGTDSYTTFQPKVYDMNGREAENIVPHVMMAEDIKDVLRGMTKRIVELAPDESMIHQINLKRFYNLEIDKKYRVKCFFYPDIGSPGGMNFIIDGCNESAFKIVKSRADTIKSAIIARETRKKPVRDITPSEVVFLALDAEKAKNWERMVKYIDIEKFIFSYPDFVDHYSRADEEGKLKVEEKFIKFLSRERDDYILKYTITGEETDSAKKVSYVTVLIDRNAPRKPVKYKYTFILQKNSIENTNLWLITKLEATVTKGINP